MNGTFVRKDARSQKVRVEERREVGEHRMELLVFLWAAHSTGGLFHWGSYSPVRSWRARCFIMAPSLEVQAAPPTLIIGTDRGVRHFIEIQNEK